MATFIQESFKGGMDTLSDDTQIASNAYRLLINGRPRLGSIEPIRDSLLLNAPVGNKQGIFGVGNILILFVSGYAYYKSLDDTIWIRIADFVLDSAVEYIYSYPVAASTINNKRILNPDSDISGTVTLASQFVVSGTPSGLVCQDGINQPWLIFYEPDSNSARARRCKTYDEWSNTSSTADDREYVPIGSKMFTFNNILFTVAPDGYTIYRSVSGRPMDYMVNIDKDGNKLATESLGGARSVSFACSSEPITYIGSLDSDHFMVGTAKSIYAVSFSATGRTIFAEPTFDTPRIFSAGIVNQFAVCDKLGDIAFIDYEGIKSFNGVQQFKFEGNNDVFSLEISKLLVNPIDNVPIRQGICASISFDNYSIFSINSRMGYLLAIYDNLLAKWVSVDITGANRIKQFTTTNTETQSLLFAITSTNKVFQILGSNTRATAILTPKCFTMGDARIKHKTTYCRPVFQLGTTLGKLMVTEYVDDMRGQNATLPIAGAICGVKPPIIPPVIPSTVKLVDNKAFLMREGQEGYKLSYTLNWNTASRLKSLEVETSGIVTAISKEQLTSNL